MLSYLRARWITIWHMTIQSLSITCKDRLSLNRIEAAQALGISPITLDRLTKRGLLNPSRATRKPLYPVWELERFLRETTAAI